MDLRRGNGPRPPAPFWLELEHMNRGCKLIVAAACLLAVWSLAGSSALAAPPGQGAALQANQEGQVPADRARDIKWFKDKLGIAPQYRERSSGVLGMSWPHFLVMVFLVGFFVAALVAVYVRNRRTRQLLMELVKERSHEPQG
jgi:ABC-type Na+ efflux pump permease subunit